jgi:alkylation response protein AidB-like acyl-CoA dehydrogenase
MSETHPGGPSDGAAGRVAAAPRTAALQYSPEAEAFRAEVRGWLDEHLPKGWGTDQFEHDDETSEGFIEQWTRQLVEGGWICASWPVEYGGRGLSLIESVVLEEEFEARHAPMRADFFGDTLVGPTILRFGTEEQKAFFLPKIRSGEITWCQGFSEPNAGSDLASLTTRATLDGDEWVIDGQKVWTTQAQRADYIFLLARTGRELTGHRGISYLLVAMDQPGIEVRPIRQISGTAEFNEVFFSSARCPAGNVVGGIDNGWTVAMTTLGFERGASATTGHRRFATELAEIIEIARRNGRSRDPLIRQRLASAWSKVKIMEINGLRSLAAARRRDQSATALAATNKIFWSEYHREVMELAMAILGLEGQILPAPAAPLSSRTGLVSGAGTASDADYPLTSLQASFLFSRSETIWGGTAEIQRNIVGERVLGLDKEPAAAPGTIGATTDREV